jgi:uncharacterized membrane protein
MLRNSDANRELLGMLSLLFLIVGGILIFLLPTELLPIEFKAVLARIMITCVICGIVLSIITYIMTAQKIKERNDERAAC